MDWLFGFLLGFISDLVRSVFLPASTEWLSKFLPASKRKVNREDNILILETMERLTSLGKDPSLAGHIFDSSEHFLSMVTHQREAYVDSQIDLIDTINMTQFEITEEAFRRYEVANRQMQDAFKSIIDTGLLDGLHQEHLETAQLSWEKFRDEQSEYHGLLFIGGSQRPVVQAHELELLTIQRTGQLKEIYEELTHMYGE